MIQLADQLAIQTRWIEQEAEVALHGELDEVAVPLLNWHLVPLVGQEPERIDMEMAKLSFIDCAGARALMWPRRILPESCPVVLHSPGRAVDRVLQLTGLAEGCRVED